ncbi:hypothetical protein B0H67DRAFT_375049 [Lasiosphaeris hirsuta]|uniref:BHLH domain-containing protein n=1 Tax=Lasiosphaeris hirsuta TaxID=260670 RepID=A0AA39ZX66_9PEZI|nr:hypothetical protein B0H67DRAFT_375049 [Lasiosphaeris hirsuta]
MGSQRPQYNPLPFGCENPLLPPHGDVVVPADVFAVYTDAVNQTPEQPQVSDFEFTDPNAPNPGNTPLFSENDDKTMSGWLSAFNGEGPTEPVYGETGMMEYSDHWMPHVVGHNTSFGQLDTLHQSNNFLTVTPNTGIEFVHPAATIMPPPVSTPPQPTDTNHSPDVVAAAAILGGPGGASMPAYYGTPAMSPTSTAPTIGYGQPHSRQHNQPQALTYSFTFGPEMKQSALTHSHDFNNLTNIYWGNEYSDRSLPTTRQTRREEALFGSDTSFNQLGGFRPSSYMDSSEHMMKQQANILGCLEPTDSAVTTRVSSPAMQNGQLQPSAYFSPPKSQTRPLKLKQEADPEPKTEAVGPKNKKRAKEEAEDGGDIPSPRPLSNKRRKTNPAITVRTTLDPSPPISPVRRRREPTSATSGKRPKSGKGAGRGGNNSNAARPPRENLTDEQKRENHIKSEQKRRTMIKDGFDDLALLIPGLTSGGQSKSQMLTTVGNFITALQRGNKELESLLQGRGHDII